MKKQLFFVAASMVIIIGASAQTKFGVQAGVIASEITLKSTDAETTDFLGAKKKR